MIERIHGLTLDYIESVSKSQRKKIGQFFTQPSIARFMATLMDWDNDTIKILDPGAGSGILATALCEKCLENNIFETIQIDLYENNQDVLPVLRESMEYVREVMHENGRNFVYNIIEENFILSNANFWNNNEDIHEDGLYDVVISNPPYKKISKRDEESIAMQNIVYGQPNIYFLFMAMSAKLLRNEGQLIFITPRSFTSGAYFRKFREWFLNNVHLSNIHLFHSREDVFNTDSVLQETLILKAVKTDKNIDRITITTSPNATFSNIDTLEVPTNTVIDRTTDNLYILIPTTQEEVEVMNLINSWTHTMPQLGFKLSTGKVVDFRATQFLKYKKEEDTTNLFWACNFSNNKIVHPFSHIKSPQYIVSNYKSRSLLIDNKDYIFVKRFTSKEEPKRIQCALYFGDKYDYERIGVENHLNYITKLNGDFHIEELYGLFSVLNSTYVDKYYRILNGSTQVNASEMNSIPLPALDLIREIGMRVIRENNITIEFCDNIIYELFIDNKEIWHVI